MAEAAAQGKPLTCKQAPCDRHTHVAGTVHEKGMEEVGEWLRTRSFGALRVKVKTQDP